MFCALVCVRPYERLDMCVCVCGGEGGGRGHVHFSSPWSGSFGRGRYSCGEQLIVEALSSPFVCIMVIHISPFMHACSFRSHFWIAKKNVCVCANVLVHVCVSGARCFHGVLPSLHSCHSENNPVKTEEMRISQHAILICTPRYQRMLIKIIFCICLVFQAHMQIASVAFQHSVIRFMKDSCNT